MSKPVTDDTLGNIGYSSIKDKKKELYTNKNVHLLKKV